MGAQIHSYQKCDGTNIWKAVPKNFDKGEATFKCIVFQGYGLRVNRIKRRREKRKTAVPNENDDEISNLRINDGL